MIGRGNDQMVKAVKRKPEELGYELANGDSLLAMTPKEIKLMNAEFEMVASNKLLAERAIKVHRFPAACPCPDGAGSITAVLEIAGVCYASCTDQVEPAVCTVFA